jgi:hypothetical protein
MADLVTLAQLKSYLKITDSSDDTELALAITSATTAIQRATNRLFAPQDLSATTRSFTASAPSGLQPFLMPSTMFNYWFPFQNGFIFPDGVVPVDDLFMTNQTIANVTVVDHLTGASLAIDRGWPFNNPAKGLPFTALYFGPSVSLPRGDGGVDVTAKFEWPAVPSTIQTACMLQATRYFKRAAAPFGIAGDIAQGSGMRLFSQLDPDVSMMVADFRRPWAVAGGGPFSNGATY